MHISVVIPSLNSPTINLTLKALLQQGALSDERITEYEVVVVGRDEANLISPHPQVRFIDTGSPMPPAQARNLGAAETQGELLCFMDADCIPVPSWLGTLLERFEDPTVEIVGGGVTFSDDAYWTLADNLATFYEYLAMMPAGTRAQLPSLNLAVRRSTWESLGHFHQGYPVPAGEDSEWTMRARTKGKILHFVPDAMIEHRPKRNQAQDLLSHAYRLGRYSIKLSNSYPGVVQTPFPLKHWLLILLTAPALAAGVTLKAMRASRWQYARTMPAIFLGKIAWCCGAIVTKWRQDHPLTLQPNYKLS